MKFIGLLAGLAGGKTWVAWLIAGGSVLAVLGGAYLWIDHGGFVRGVDQTTQKYERELERVERDNQQAIDDANAFYREQLRINRLKDEERNALLEEIDRLSAASPGGGELGLGRDSVRRLNAIR